MKKKFQSGKVPASPLRVSFSHLWVLLPVDSPCFLRGQYVFFPILLRKGGML